MKHDHGSGVEHCHVEITILLFICYLYSVQQQQVETAATRVRLHLRGGVWLQQEFPEARRTLPRTASPPRPAPQLQTWHRRQSRLQWRDGPWWDRGQTPHEGAG